MTSLIERRKELRLGPQAESQPALEQLTDIYLLTRQAQEEWADAWCFFQQATAEDMVDNAIFALNAAEKRYNYFLKLSKEERQVAGGEAQ